MIQSATTVAHAATFTIVDYLILATIFISVLISFIRGFMREVLSLVIWVAAAFVALKFSSKLSPVLQTYLHSSGLSYVLAFAVLFIGVLIVGVVLNVLFGLLIRRTGVGAIDRLLGILFGAARGVLVVAIILLLVGFTPMNKDDSMQGSILLPHFEPLVVWLNQFIPNKMDALSTSMGIDSNGSSVKPLLKKNTTLNLNSNPNAAVANAKAPSAPVTTKPATTSTIPDGAVVTLSGS